MRNVARQLNLLTAILAVTVAIAGCSESSRAVATGKGSVRGINAIASAPEVNFLIEERSVGGADYKQVAGFNEYDDLEYTFNFDTIAFGDQPARRLASQLVNVQADTAYTFVLTGSIANPAITLWESPERDWQDTETVFEIDFVHLSPLLGQVDVYFAEAGTVPVHGNQIATMQNGDRIPYREFPAATYEFIVTAPADPGTIMFQSSGLIAAGASRVTLALFDVDPTITAEIAAVLINDSGLAAPLPDVNHPSHLRMMNARFNGDNVDAYFDADFDNIVFSDIQYAELSPYADVPGEGAVMTLTDVGDPGSTVFEAPVSAPANSRVTALYGGPDGTIIYKFLLDNARPVSTYPLARISNMVTNIALVDIYLLAPGTPVNDDVIPTVFGMGGATDTGFLPLETGALELTVTLNGDKTAISTPLEINAVAGDILDLVLLDTADPAAVELRVFDSFQP
jgi:hypothetical protein